MLRGLEPRAIFVSARTGEGLDELLTAVAGLLPSPQIELELLIPYERGDLIATLHEQGRVLSTAYAETGSHVKALVTPEIRAQFAPFLSAPASA